MELCVGRKDRADSPAALIALAGPNASDARLGQFKRGAHVIFIFFTDKLVMQLAFYIEYMKFAIKELG
jgi:hypothetical protein